jgi:transcriptional regulator with XRE-family HTH domain
VETAPVRCFTKLNLKLIANVIALGVPKVPEADVEDLRSYILRTSRRKHLTLQQIAERAELAGIQIEQSTLESIVSGASDNPTIELLRGLASGLEEPITDVVAAAFQLRRETPLARRVTLRQFIWDLLDEDAARCNRTPEEQLTEILTNYFKLRSLAVNPSSATGKSRRFGFLIKPESDVQKLINPIKVSEKLKESGYQINAQTVLMVLSKMNQEIDVETVRVTVSMAQQMYPEIIEVTE